MITKREYLNLLNTYPTALIQRSAANPTKYMSRIQVLLHYVVLRNRGIK